MVIVWVLAQTNLFEWLAFKMFVFSKWNIKKLYFMFFLITAVLSAFLDNVTTIFLITPVAISICKLFDLSPIRLIIALIIAVILILFGPKKLPELGKGIGEFFKNFKGSVKDIKNHTDIT